MHFRAVSSQLRRVGVRAALWSLAVLAWAHALPADAQQPCQSLPKPGAAPVSNGEKFAFIGRHCDVLAEPGQVRRSPLLGVYDRGASVTIQMAPPAEAANAPAATPPATPAPTHSPAPLGRDGQRVLSLVPALTAAAREHGLDPLLLHAIAHVESRHNAAAVSPAGARGVMQVMPATGQRFGVSDERALLNAETNVRAGASYLRTLVRRYGAHDLRRVLAAYNAGEGAVDKHGGVPPYAETRAYVRDVMAIYARLREEFTPTPDGELKKAGGLS
jgi:soluble lytic murein transglycosylase-like protein